MKHIYSSYLQAFGSPHRVLSTTKASQESQEYQCLAAKGKTLTNSVNRFAGEQLEWEFRWAFSDLLWLWKCPFEWVVVVCCYKKISFWLMLLGGRRAVWGGSRGAMVAAALWGPEVVAPSHQEGDFCSSFSQHHLLLSAKHIHSSVIFHEKQQGNTNKEETKVGRDWRRESWGGENRRRQKPRFLNSQCYLRKNRFHPLVLFHSSSSK